MRSINSRALGNSERSINEKKHLPSSANGQVWEHRNRKERRQRRKRRIKNEIKIQLGALQEFSIKNTVTRKF